VISTAIMLRIVGSPLCLVVPGRRSIVVATNAPQSVGGSDLLLKVVSH